MSPRSNVSLAFSLLAVVAGMLMLAYASVPLYRIFCQSTGFGGVAEATSKKVHPVINRIVTVRFDANVGQGLDWDFKPVQTQVEVKAGEEKHIEYSARNRAFRKSTGTATFNITPVKAGIYFNKIQCFCFTQQALKPGEEKRLGVTFFIDPAMNDDRDLDEVHTITLSYTFFPVNK